MPVTAVVGIVPTLTVGVDAKAGNVPLMPNELFVIVGLTNNFTPTLEIVLSFSTNNFPLFVNCAIPVLPLVIVGSVAS